MVLSLNLDLAHKRLRLVKSQTVQIDKRMIGSSTCLETSWYNIHPLRWPSFMAKIVHATGLDCFSDGQKWRRLLWHILWGGHGNQRVELLAQNGSKD